MQETQVQSLGWEDPLEKEMATHSSILGWRTPWTEKPGGLQSMGSQRVGHDQAVNTLNSTECECHTKGAVGWNIEAGSEFIQSINFSYKLKHEKKKQQKT